MVNIIKKEGDYMTCPKCGSENVTTSVVNETYLKTKHKGILYWLCIGFWWEPIKWMIFTLPALIFAIFKPKKQKMVNKTKTVHACQSCGYTW